MLAYCKILLHTIFTGLIITLSIILWSYLDNTFNFFCKNKSSDCYDDSFYILKIIIIYIIDFIIINIYYYLFELLSLYYEII